MAGIGFNWVKGHQHGARRLHGALGAFGAATAYPAVGRLQSVLLSWKPSCLPRYHRDEKYGGEVHKALKGFMDALRVGQPGIASRDDIDSIGPDAVRSVLFPVYVSTVADMDTIQQAWREWKNAPPAVHRPADAPVDAEEATMPPPVEESGGSALKVLGLAVGGAFLTWLIWTIATDDGK